MEDRVVESLWTHWHGHPDALVGLALFEGAYLLGVGPLRERYGLAESVDPRQVATFTLGVLVIFFSLVSPVHALADRYLFSAHMFQHVLLTLVAPPLLILGTPDWLLRPLLRPTTLFIAARLFTHPVMAFTLFNVVFSIWHVPGLYDLSVTNHGIHIAEHLLFMSTAMLMWWPVASTMPELPRLSYPLQMIYFFLLSIAQLIVFAPITFSSAPLYRWYVEAPRVWAVTPLVDQQIGAIIMKIGGGALFITLMIVAFFRWYKREEEEQASQQPAETEYHYGA
jgi:putative membrane protein